MQTETHTVCSTRNVTICVEHYLLTHVLYTICCYVVRKRYTLMKKKREEIEIHTINFSGKDGSLLFLLSSAIFHKQWHTHTHTHESSTVIVRNISSRWWSEWKRTEEKFSLTYRCIANVSNQNTSKIKTTTTNDMRWDEMRWGKQRANEV